MRIYRNCEEAVKDIGRELKKCATNVHTQTMQNKQIADDPDYNTKEIQAFSFTILDQDDRNLMPGVTLKWAEEELLERTVLPAKNPGQAWLLRKEVWSQFINEYGEFDYTYPERIHWQLDKNIEELKKHPETRQAIIEIHDRDKDQAKMGKERIPCSMFYQFMIRDGKLDVIYVMRSSDFATHFQNDMWLAMGLRDFIARHVGIEPGKFIMFVSSLHIYKKDWDVLQNY